MFFIPTAFAAQVQNSAQTTQSETMSGVGSVFETIASGIPYWIAAVVVLVLSVFLARIAKKMVVYRVTSKSRYDFHQEVIILIERSVFFTIIFLGLIISFRIVGIDIATLLGFLGLGLGFAFKDLLSNFIAGVVILTQKKFMLGDKVEVNGVFGKITEIETRTTQIQAIDGTIHIIPNSDMLTSVVQNVTRNSFRRYNFSIGVHYSTPLKEAIELTIQVVKKHPDVVEKPAPQVVVTAFGESAITLDIRFWLESTATWPPIMSEIMQAVKIAYDKAHIEIPYPIRTLTLDSYDKNLFTALNLPKNEQERSGEPLLHKQEIPTNERLEALQKENPQIQLSAEGQVQP